MSIVEIPLDSAEVEEPDALEEATVEVEEAPKRARGRPKGALNKKTTPPPAAPIAPPSPAPSPVKTKAKPRKPAPVEKKPKKKAIVYDSSSSEEEDAVQVPDTHRIAGEVLAMLSSQRTNQRVQRRNRYASWFQNM